VSANARAILVAAGLLLALATIFGAMGTHVLRARLSPEQLSVFETAVRYHFYNALGLLAIGVLAVTLHAPLLRWSAWLIVAGIVLFSGTLYAASLGAPRAIHFLPPFGGVALIAGWVLFAWGIWRAR
jgi:uncharacterized membrane protein YgdD (TMEM256/DUF423 family)